MNWPDEQYQQLTEHYRDLPDEALLALAAAPEDLTEIAEEVLRRELADRNLVPSSSSPPAPHREPIKAQRTGDEQQVWLDYAYRAPEDCIFFFPTARQSNDAGVFLAESGIESQVLAEDDTFGPRLVVRPNDADEAAKVLAEPIPEHITSEPEFEVPDFDPPSCPACQTPDPVLIAVDPTNRWLCEACEHEWDDPFEDDPSEESPAE